MNESDWYALLADVVLTVHFAFVVFVVVGLPVIVAGGVAGWPWVRNRWFRGAHVFAIFYVAGEAWLGVVCPLTQWENDLRGLAGQSGYDSTFVAVWLHRLMYFSAPEWVFTFAYTLFGLLVVLTWVCWPPRWRRARPRRDGASVTD